jgi:HPt (histidine-containing phosphotransfer) domain-containing protein
MLSIDMLQQFGANTREGLGRCMNNETFYLRLVNMGLDDASFDRLEAALRNDDRKAAFEAAHALKGVMGNLALTPLYEQLSELTELLRADSDADYPALLNEIMVKRRALIAFRGD